MEPKKTSFLLLLALLWTISITVACLADMSDVPAASIENIDKAAHLFFYAVFSMLWLSYFRSRIQNTRKLFLAVFFFSATFGITIEFCQAVFTDYRQADLIDAAVNTIGAVLGLSLMALFIKKNKK